MKEVRIMKENITYYLVWIICLLAGCAPTPKQIEDTTDPIPMYPDYTDIMIPTNIAPLNFLLRNDADAMQVTLKGESKEIQLSFGKKAIFPLNLWESLLEQEVGNRLQITVVARIKGKWLRYPSFYWQVVPEKLDSYIGLSNRVTRYGTKSNYANGRLILLKNGLSPTTKIPTVLA